VARAKARQAVREGRAKAFEEVGHAPHMTDGAGRVKACADDRFAELRPF
jgi:hypothetical protein